MESNWYPDLVTWINSNGGYINKSLGLEENTPDARGIYANGDISKGSLLIRLPASLALCGDNFPSQYEFEFCNRNASNWLRCIAALIAEFLQKDPKFDKYVSSLPQSYETLLHETSWSDAEVKSYLAGTTIGKMVVEDRKSSAMKTRFEKSVKPFLVANKVIDQRLMNNGDELFAMFQMACACVSTRGFHLREDDENNSNNSGGPFLLPFIDLLNHASSPADKCTTLQRRTAKSSFNEGGNLVQDGFFMTAECDIRQGEEILHSYGRGLTSGQLLQTFGFVEDGQVQRAIGQSFDINGITAAAVSKTSIINACAHITSSSIPQELERMILTDPDLQDFDVWSLPEAGDLEARNSGEVQRQILDELIITYSEPLSDELVTLCCAQFLPNDAYVEICGGEEDSEHKTLSLLSAEILEDFFLGSLILHAILYVVKQRLSEYSIIAPPANVHVGESPNCRDSVDEMERDRFMLEILAKERTNDRKKESNVSEKELNHAIYGLTLRIEEKACLLKLKEDCDTLLQSFKKTAAKRYTTCTEQPCKRIKL